MNMDEESINKMRDTSLANKKEYTNEKKVYLYDPAETSIAHTNIITEDYLDYIKAIDPSICNSIGYTRLVGMNLLRQIDGEIRPVTMAIGINVASGGEMDMQSMSSSMTNMTSMNGIGLTSYPETLGKSTESYLEKNYDLLAGSYPSDETGLVLVVDNQNRVDYNTLKNLGFTVDNVDSIDFEKIVGTELKLIANDTYYTETELGSFIPDNDYDTMYNSKDSITLKITGIIRLKSSVSLGVLGNGIAYSDKLVQRITTDANSSEIVIAQREADYNVMTMEQLDEASKSAFLTYLGGNSTPFMIFLYPSSFEAKDAVLNYLNAYNTGKAEKDTIIYTDLASTITKMTSGIMNAITLVLIAFAAISLIVSLIMIGIITYISVLERTKEIGVLRALGARKKDITRVFNAETFIIGSCSGLLGIAIAYLLTIPANILIENMTDLPNVAQLNPLHALALVAISVILTLIGGSIPAKMAAKKDPVEALRTE